jgi:hypothetical protein
MNIALWTLQLSSESVRGCLPILTDHEIHWRFRLHTELAAWLERECKTRGFGVKVVTQSAHHAGSWDWDCTVALEYAAEQLLKVSELPRGVIAPSSEALNISYLRCISCLLQHEDLLPKTVAIALRDAWQQSQQVQQLNASKAQCNFLASRLLTILRDVANLLATAKSTLAA